MANEYTCKCGSCEKPEAERDAREAYIALVHTVGDRAGPGFWEARAQGKLAALENRPITDNPWRNDSHINRYEFERGYNSVNRTPREERTAPTGPRNGLSA